MNKLCAIIIFILLLVNVDAKAQLISNGNLILGSEVSMYISRPANNNVSFPNISVFSFSPFLDVKIKENIFLGINYETSFGEAEHQKIPSTQGYGAQIKLFHCSIFNDPLFKNRILFNTELNFKKTNYYLDFNEQYGYALLPSFSNHIIDISFNVNFRMYKAIYLNAGYRAFYHTYNDYFIYGPKLGIQYHFNEKRKPMQQIEKPKIKEGFKKKFKLFSTYFV